jgi:hypothetical protein
MSPPGKARRLAGCIAFACIAFAGVERLLPAQDGLGSLLEAADAPPKKAGASGQRPSAPSAAAAKQALAQVKDVFRDDYARATTPQARASLARQLIGQSAKSASPAECWALLTEAMRLASDAGDSKLSFEAIDLSAERFAIDGDDFKAEAIVKLAGKAPPAELDGLAQEAVAIARKAADADNVALTSKSLAVANSLARKTRNRALLAEAAKIQQAVRSEDKESRERAAIKEKVSQNPNDPDICLEAGRYFCFKADDWKSGLPLLAKGSDAELSRLAVAESNAGRAANGVIAVADAWWQWAEKERGFAKSAGMLHASDLYQSLVDADTVQGLERVRLEKRIREASDLNRQKQRSTWLADIPPATTSNIAFGLKTDGTYQGKPYACKGRQWPKGLTSMPTGMSFASITYALPEGSKRLVGTAGVFKPEGASEHSQPASPQRFEILVDGRSAWKSGPLPRVDDTSDFDVELFGAKTVELRTNSDSGNSAWAAWLEVQVIHR